MLTKSSKKGRITRCLRISGYSHSSCTSPRVVSVKLLRTSIVASKNKPIVSLASET